MLERVLNPRRTAVDDNQNQREIFNLLDWLTRAAPNCSQTTARFAEFSSQHPEFGPIERPNTDLWMGPPKVGLKSPCTDKELLAKPPHEQLEFLISFKSDQTLGQSREALIDNVNKAVANQYEWGISLLQALKQKEWLQPDLSRAVIDGWRQANLTSAQWEEILKFLLDDNRLLGLVKHEASSLLEKGITNDPNGIPDVCLYLAVRLSMILWNKVSISDNEKKETAEDWLLVAINRPAGIIMETFLRALSRMRKQSGDKWRELAPEQKKFLESVLAGTSFAAELGRIVLASQLHFIFSLDEEWAARCVVALFDLELDSRRALQAWHGLPYLGQMDSWVASPHDAVLRKGIPCVTT